MEVGNHSVFVTLPPLAAVLFIYLFIYLHSTVHSGQALVYHGSLASFSLFLFTLTPSPALLEAEAATL